VTGGARTPARFQLLARPTWRLRLGRELPRYLACAAALAGLAASLRFAVAPPGPLRSAVMPAVRPADPGAAAYAVMFARRFLTWNAADPEASVASLEGFGGGSIEASVGFSPPPEGAQSVSWAEVVQQRERGPGAHVYTVAAQTSPGGLIYVAVPVERTSLGLRLGGYPAFVGPPASARTGSGRDLRQVEEPGLEAMVARALRNYLSGAAAELASDLEEGAQVSLPRTPLTLESIQRLAWAPDGRSVVAVVQAQDARQAQFTLEYEIDVARTQGRWEVGAVEMDPLA